MKMLGRERVAATAVAHGWTVKALWKGAPSMGHVITKGVKRVIVSYSALGGVLAASLESDTATHVIVGADRAGQIIALLTTMQVD
jgi:hypothetical protein